MTGRDPEAAGRDLEPGAARQVAVKPGSHPTPSDGKPENPHDRAFLLKKLHWRCRRGTRELDALLGGWLDAHAATLDAMQFAAFDALLDEQDPELWDWLMGHAEVPRADWRAIVADIRHRANLAP